MSRWIRRIILALVGLVALLVLAVAIYLPIAARASFPQIDGDVQVAGLDGRVDVYRDAAGIPHIYASTEHDLFLAQGYVQAQDRFWQMDFQRHVSAGSLSELMGSATLDTDLFLRTLGWERVAREELEALDAGSLSMLEAFSEGVNAYLAERQGAELSFEYLFLNLVNSGYEPEPWEPLDTLTWAKAMAWDLRDNMSDEIQRSILLASMDAERIAELYPDYPQSHPVIVEQLPAAGGESSVAPGVDAGLNAPLLPDFQRAGERMAALDLLLGGLPEAELGSNSWVVSGELSASGAPLMANDPHLEQSMPSIWYQVGLHCTPVGPDCGYEAVGVAFASAPGVIIGHNDRIAWGFTNAGADVMDLYIIKLNPADPNQYEMNGEWVDMQIVEENVQVGGGESVLMPVRVTEFGPIISETYGALDAFDEGVGIELPEDYAVALRWTALEPGTTFQAVLQFARAQNWDEFREAASLFVVPSQNLLYADVEGNIGYQMPGWIPIRAAGDGRYPVPGWTDEYAWQGYIPFEEMPYAFNPASGYIVTANNAIVGLDYPYQLVDTWDYGYRAQRILELIGSANGPLDTADYQAIHMDALNLGALEIIPALRQVDLEDEGLQAARAQLGDWDGQQSVDSAPAALFNAFWQQLLAMTFRDELPEDYWPGGGSRWYIVVANLLAEPDNAWWDDLSTAAIEDRDAVLQAAFAAGVEELEASQGSDAAEWRWGGLHTITFQHQVMSDFPLGIAKLFNRGPFEVPGGPSIVNATGWDAASGDYTVTSIPSKRSIFDLSDWEQSLQIIATGNSGHAYHPHNADMAPVWAVGEYLPMHWERSVIEAEAEGHLILAP
jgi:penicillin amidase